MCKNNTVRYILRTNSNANVSCHISKYAFYNISTEQFKKLQHSLNLQMPSNKHVKSLYCTLADKELKCYTSQNAKRTSLNGVIETCALIS